MATQDFLGLGPDVHRIVPISASQSLHASATPAGPGVIPSGLPQLDEAICRDVLGGQPELIGDANSMGVLCGHITEVFGPPGVGKTSLALSTASNALREGRKVVWIDTGSPIPKPRLRSMLQNPMQLQNDGPPSTIPDNPAKDLVYFRAQSLPHLLALLMRPPKGFPPEGTSLLVIDSISGPFPSYFLNPTELKSRLSEAGLTDKPKVQWLMYRKWNVTSDLGHQLVKLASAHRMAVLLVNQTHTKIKGQPRPTLYPSLSGGSWENSIHTRIVLYRDFPREQDQIDESAPGKTRFAEVLKRSGKPLIRRLDANVIPFVIESAGLREIEKVQQQQQPPCPVSQKSTESTATETRRKRKVDEIADSQDEDEGSDEEYGWTEGDDADLIEKSA